MAGLEFGIVGACFEKSIPLKPVHPLDKNLKFDTIFVHYFIFCFLSLYLSHFVFTYILCELFSMQPIIGNVGHEAPV